MERPMRDPLQSSASWEVPERRSISAVGDDSAALQTLASQV